MVSRCHLVLVRCQCREPYKEEAVGGWRDKTKGGGEGSELSWVARLRDGNNNPPLNSEKRRWKVSVDCKLLMLDELPYIT